MSFHIGPSPSIGGLGIGSYVPSTSRGLLFRAVLLECIISHRCISIDGIWRSWVRKGDAGQDMGIGSDEPRMSDDYVVDGGMPPPEPREPDPDYHDGGYGIPCV